MILHLCEEVKCSFLDVNHLQCEPPHSMSSRWKEHPSVKEKKDSGVHYLTLRVEIELQSLHYLRSVTFVPEEIKDLGMRIGQPSG